LGFKVDVEKEIRALRRSGDWDATFDNKIDVKTSPIYETSYDLS